MCQRHQKAQYVVQQFADNIYPNTQQLLDRAASSHGGFDALDSEQQLLSLFLATKDQVAQLINYDVKLVFPSLQAMQHRQAIPNKVNLLEVNELLRNKISKIEHLTQTALDLYPSLPAAYNEANNAMLDFFAYLEKSFLIAYCERLVFFDNWYLQCKCMHTIAATDQDPSNNKSES